MADGELEGDPAAHAVAEGVGLIDPQVPHQGRHVVGHPLVGYGPVDVGGASVSLHLGDDHPPGLGQAGQDRPHGVDRHVGAVQQDQRPAFAVDLIVHPETVNLSVVALDSVHPFPFLLAAGAGALARGRSVAHVALIRSPLPIVKQEHTVPGGPCTGPGSYLTRPSGVRVLETADFGEVL